MKKEEEYKADYEKFKASGMMWEIKPNYTGEWEKDKEDFIGDQLVVYNECDVALEDKMANENTNENTNETPIAKVRNLLSPINNYFFMKQTDLSGYDKDTQQQFKDLLDKELMNCFEVMPKLLKLIKNDDNWK